MQKDNKALCDLTVAQTEPSYYAKGSEKERPETHRWAHSRLKQQIILGKLQMHSLFW